MFTSQELAKLKAADPDDVISVRVGQIADLIEQKERLFKQNEQFIEQFEQLLAKDVRSEEEKAEYRSKIGALPFGNPVEYFFRVLTAPAKSADRWTPGRDDLLPWDLSVLPSIDPSNRLSAFSKNRAKPL